MYTHIHMPGRYLFIRVAYVCVFCIQGVCRRHFTKEIYYHNPEQCLVYENSLTNRIENVPYFIRTTFVVHAHYFVIGYRHVIPETVSVFQSLVMTIRFPMHGFGQIRVFLGFFNTTPCQRFLPKICFTSFFRLVNTLKRLVVVQVSSLRCKTIAFPQIGLRPN